jgi:two-component system, OmpR family, sensor histidine kinase MtrB
MTLAFAVGGLALSALLAGITFVVAQHYLLSQRQSTATRQTYDNARLVRSGLEAVRPNVSEVLGSVQTPTASASVIEYAGSWFSSSVAIDRDALPISLRDLVDNGDPGRQRFLSASGPALAVGVPLPAADASYFEVFGLSDLRQTLNTLLAALGVAALGTTVVGAFVGRWASGRVLRPVTEVSQAAAKIAEGGLDTRLAPNTDRDLDVLVDSFNAMVASLAARVERDARFASDVSHELRSPLTTLATAAEVVARHRDELDERSRAALDLLVADLERFRRLVEDLLEISRSEAGAMDGNEERVNVAELVGHAMQSNGDSTVPLVLEGRARVATVQADKRRLERVLSNLLDNARDHGGGATAVRVATVNGHVRIMVDDDGPGVPDNDRSQIFERFSRGEGSSRRTPGSGVGLGLAIVAEHARRQGGQAWVESAPSGGARFVVDLPTSPEP